MSSTLVFNEPEDSANGPYSGLAAWFRHSASVEARTARQAINAWYARFPDREGMVFSRLRDHDDINVFQAIDELYVHYLLASSCEPRYEEDTEEGKRNPDFRLYKSSVYVASVEVYTLFPEKSFGSEVSRNSRLVDEINRRVQPTDWYVFIEVIKWRRQPRVGDIARWLETENARLRTPDASLASEDYPVAIYSGPEVELAFSFIPRSQKKPLTAGRSIIVAGPPVVKFVSPERRLRRALVQKSGSTYNHHNRSFAVVVSVRDYSCDIESVVNALYGDEVIRFDIGNPNSSYPDRRRNGVFTISAANPQGRNRRLSCVFILMRGWVPGSDVTPSLLRFDNPFASHPFPDGLLVPARRFVPKRDDSGIHMEWRE